MDDRHGVLVGIDGSDGATRAMDWAADEATRRDLPLTLLHAYGAVLSTGPFMPRVGISDSVRIVAEGVMDETVTRLKQKWPRLEVRTQLVSGRPVQELLDASSAASMLVLGSHGRSRLGRLVLGSVSQHVATHAATPVIVVRGAETLRSRDHIAVGTDGSDLSEAAIGFAFEEAALRNMPLVVVHAWRADAYIDYRLFVLDDDVSRQLEQEAADLVGDVLSSWRQKFPQVPVRARLTPAHPVNALLEESSGARLLVLGSRGHGAFTGMLLGSVAAAALHEADCPVAVVRP